MRSLIKFLFLGSSLCWLTGCASTDDQTASDRQVSSVPWNKPQRWESGGQLGGMMGQ
jgi:hypothetical protein